VKRFDWFSDCLTIAALKKTENDFDTKVVKKVNSRQKMRIHISLAYCMLGTVVPFCHGFVQTNKGVFGRNSHQPSSTLGRSTTDSSGALKSSHYSIDVSDTGPAGGPVHTLTINSLPGDHLAERNEPIVLQTGKLGRQAAGAVTLTRGDTVLYATAARDELPKEGLDFLPLSVEHQERFSSVGMTSGGYNKRDGRPAEHEVLTCRLIDRPLRPLIAKGWRHETQLLSWVMSYDGERSCDPLAITASATAMYLSDIPLSKPVAAAMVGYDAENDKLLLNPTNEEMKKSTLKLIVAGTKDAVLMIEGAADFLPEAIMIRAVNFGHEALKAICVAVEELGDTLKIVKKMDTLVLPPEGLQERINELMTEKVIKTFEGGGTKITQGPKLKALKKEVTEILKEQDGEEFAYTSNDIADCFTDLLIRQIYERAKATGKRCDNREFTQIRHLDMEAGFLPRTHGSAIFTRGETQVVATVTLGDSGMRQKIDQIDGTLVKRFYLQYTFPPSCVGETGRTGAPGRREVGHGNLAERYVLKLTLLVCIKILGF
jgi:polyribonucleotide nucleotidyltransferase